MKPNNSEKPASPKRLSVPQVIFWVLTVALMIGLFIFARDFVTCWRLTSLPGVPPSDCSTVSVNPQGTPLVNAEGTPLPPEIALTPPVIIPLDELPEPWDGASRVTVLLIGLDYRDWQAGEGAPRSDTMMLLTIDPMSQTAGMLSIPRDMWVLIPGFGYGKINTAYSLGESYKLPGGGPALAVKTVEQFIGVPVQYYAQIDFSAFVRMIDEIGGVQIDVKEEVIIDIIGDGIRTSLPPGVYTLPGDWALAYARSRSTEGGDVDRAKRQQQVVMAIRNQFLRLDILPIVLPKVPTLYQELSSGINTNMALDDAIKLGMLALQIPDENIKRGVIDYSMVTLGKSPDGKLDIFKPMPDKIRVLRDEIFVTGGPLSPAAIGGDPAELMRTEAARVKVLNGSYTFGLADRTSSYLTSLGMNVIAVGNADQLPGRTILVDYSGKPYTLRYLWDLMHLESSSQIQMRFDPNAGVDIVIILGDDWANNNPMP